MIILQKLFKNSSTKILALLLVLLLFQSCKVYQKSTTLEQASQANQNGFVKVTMVNGDEYIYESIELNNGNYYGIKTVNEEIVKTTLLKDDVLKVERHTKKSSGFLTFMGITIGVASVILVILMFGG